MEQILFQPLLVQHFLPFWSSVSSGQLQSRTLPLFFSHCSSPQPFSLVRSLPLPSLFPWLSPSLFPSPWLLPCFSPWLLPLPWLSRSVCPLALGSGGPPLPSCQVHSQGCCSTPQLPPSPYFFGMAFSNFHVKTFMVKSENLLKSGCFFPR